MRIFKLGNIPYYPKLMGCGNRPRDPFHPSGSCGVCAAVRPMIDYSVQTYREPVMRLAQPPHGISAVVNIDMVSRPEVAFAHIVPINLTSIFTGYGPLPAVTGTQEQTGRWDAAGQTRRVTLSDGSTAQERLTGYESGAYFSYTVSDFSGTLRYLATSAEGEWWFAAGERAGQTHVRWRYQFNSRSRLTQPALWLITTLFWRGYMNKALGLCKQQVEALR